MLHISPTPNTNLFPLKFPPLTRPHSPCLALITYACLATLVSARYPVVLTFTLPLSLAPEPVGSVSKLQILNASSDILRVTWIGVPGATSYRLTWGRSEGMAP